MIHSGNVYKTRLMILPLFIYLVISFNLLGCSSSPDIRYYIHYYSESRVFKKEIPETATKGLSHYKVFYKSGRVEKFHYFHGGRLFSIHEMVYNSSNNLDSIKSFDSKGKLHAIEFFKKNGLRLKTEFYNKMNKVRLVKYFSDYEGKHKNKLKLESLLTSEESFTYDEYNISKQITNYKYLKHNGKLNRVVDKIENLKNNKQEFLQQFTYNSLGKKDQQTFFRQGKKYKIVYYNSIGKIESEEEYDVSGKLKSKNVYDSKGNIIANKKVN